MSNTYQVNFVETPDECGFQLRFNRLGQISNLDATKRHGRQAVKKLLMVVAAGTALVTATSASAQYSGQYGGYRQGNDWNMRSGGYSRFDQQYRHTIQGIQHGLNDGTYSRSRANEFFRELQSIRREAYRAHQYGNYRDDFVQARMARLHERMHRKHDRNHARQDGYGQYYGGYEGNQPRYEEPRHGHDGHDDDGDD